MPNVPHKNIDPVLVDIKDPDVDYKNRGRKFRFLNLTRSPQLKKISSHKFRTFFRAFLILFLVLFLFVGAFGVLKFQTTKAGVASGGKLIASNFLNSLEALKLLHADKANRYLEDNKKAIGDLKELFTVVKNLNVLNFFGNIIPPFRSADLLLNEVNSFNTNLSEFIQSLAQLEKDGFTYFRTDGTALLNLLKNTNRSIGEIISNVRQIKNSTTDLKKVTNSLAGLDKTVGDYYLKHSSDLFELERFLGALTDFLDTPKEKHILLLFQNPSEIRPSGGFVGSYADVTILRGQMIGLDVRDIYDPDGQLDKKVVPPKELQTLVTDWGARDANWFFDFPISAKTVIGFLNASKMYAEKDMKFEAAVGLNMRVIESILRAIGDVELPEYKLTITADNILNEIQREVEAGKDKKAGYPKRILQVLTPILLERIGTLSEEAKQGFINSLGKHIAKKDIQFFAENSALSHFFKISGVDGSVYELPSGFWGSYLGIVNANIAGGKSDAVISQLTEARIDIDTNGNIFTDLTITRTHKGNEAKDTWWKTTNQDFIQIFTNPKSTLVAMKGNEVKKIVPKVNYETEIYEKNADVQMIESTRTEFPGFRAFSTNQFGKIAFGTWVSTVSGKTSTLEVRYETPVGNQIFLGEGSTYTFVFDKQSGVKDALKITMFAPIGYRWKESGNSYFVIEREAPESRIIEQLTLIK